VAGSVGGGVIGTLNHPPTNRYCTSGVMLTQALIERQYHDIPLMVDHEIELEAGSFRPMSPTESTLLPQECVARFSSRPTKSILLFW
jgi:hypothetical protein